MIEEKEGEVKWWEEGSMGEDRGGKRGRWKSEERRTEGKKEGET